MELKDRLLLTIALVVSIIGLISLFLVMIFAEFPDKNINDLTADDVDSKISMNGFVKGIRVYNTSSSIVLSQECTIDVLVFDRLNESLINKSITVIGKLAEDNGKKTIFADKIIIR